MVRYRMIDIFRYGSEFKTAEKNMSIDVFDFSVSLVGSRISGKRKYQRMEF